MSEENESTTSNNENTEQSRTKVGFPEAPQKKTHFPWKIIVVILVIIALGVGGWWILSGKKEEKLTSEISKAPNVQPIENLIITPTPSALSKEEIKIHVLNGTSVAGGAANLQKELSKLGFVTIDIGNADKKTYTTTETTFSQKVSEDIRTLIVTKLESLYTKVSSRDEEQDNYDIQIIIGTSKSQTPTIAETKKTTPAPTASTTITLTPTPAL